MEFEIWASDSGNMLLSTSDLGAALAWALDYWLREGDEALDALSVGDALDTWVARGDALRGMLRRRLWQPPIVATGANSSFQEESRELAIAS